MNYLLILMYLRVRSEASQRQVLEWVRSLMGVPYLSVITIGEINKGSKTSASPRKTS